MGGKEEMRPDSLESGALVKRAQTRGGMGLGPGSERTRGRPEHVFSEMNGYTLLYFPFGFL